MSDDYDIYDPDTVKELHDAVDWSIDRLGPFRETRFDHFAQCVGSLFGEECAEDSVPINMISLGTDVLMRFIAPHAPQVGIGSKYRELLPSAYDLELALNSEAERIKLGETFYMWGFDALFRMGVVTVGITGADHPPDAYGNTPGGGRLFVDFIPFDRVIVDMFAPSWDEMDYVGHDFITSFDWVKSNPSFDPEIRSKLTSSNDYYSSPNEDSSSEYSPEQMQRGSGNIQTFEKKITLRQLYLPKHRIVAIFAVGQTDKRPLKAFRWRGPEHGMYIPLRFGIMPGNIMPNAPVPQWAPLHDQINSLWNKITDQGERQKTLLLVRGAAAADGSRIINARDGDAIYSEDPGGSVEMSTGGANPQTFALALQCKDVLDWFAGNLSALGGLAPQSETLGQDKLLIQSASGRPENLQQIMLKAQLRVFQDMAFWLYNDPASEYHLIKPLGETGEFLESSWGPAERGFDFSQDNYEFDRRDELVKYDFTIDPFSAQPMSPSQKANTYMQYITGLLIPGEQGMMQQGMGLDWEFIVKTLSRLTNMPEIKRSIRYAEGEMYPDRAAIEKPGMAANTTRTNVRVNRPGATQGKSQAMIQHLMGATPQADEMSALLRPAV